jgi:lysophospholipase L1-like esterase
MNRIVWVFLLAACLASAAPLSNQDAFSLYTRTVQLMETAAVSAPELARAAAPLTENARQALKTMRESGRQNVALVYTLLVNARGFTTLAGMLPRPSPFPAEAARQFAELGDNVVRVELNFRELLDQREREVLNPDRDNLSRYAAHNAKLPPPAPDRPRVVFLGDSITDNWRLNEYYPDRDFVNRGIGGQVTSQMLCRMKADVLDLKPAVVLVLAGTNDISRGTALSTIQGNLTMIADLAQAHHIVPVFASLLPVSDYHRDQNPMWDRSRMRPPATILALNAWIEKFCRERNYLYVDYHSALVDGAGQLKSDAADDGLHPNAAGYRLMATLALAAIEKAAQPVKGKRKR